jgi:hypothetical protein
MEDTSVRVEQTEQRHIPRYMSGSVHTQPCENIKSYITHKRMKNWGLLRGQLDE